MTDKMAKEREQLLPKENGFDDNRM